MTFIRTTIRTTTFVLSFALLSGCGFSNKKHEELINQQRSLIDEQRAQIEAQSSQLNELQNAHQSMLGQLQGMNSQLSEITTQLQEKPQPPVEQPKVVYVAPKPANQAQNPSQAAASADKKMILGRVEYIWLDSAKMYLKARVDTGASASSLDATDIERFERNGERWVRFTLKHNELNVPMEAPLVRFVRIRQASLQNELDRRPVVKLKIRLGDLVEEAEFTLTNRNAMIYPVLLGRSFLQDIAVVDVAKKFTQPKSPELIEEAKKQ